MRLATLRNPDMKDGRTAERWFDTAAFAMPAPYTFGNAGRNIVYEDGETNVDLSVTKQFRANERTKVELRAEIFNVFNFLNFVRDGSPSRPTSAGCSTPVRHVRPSSG